MPVEAAREYFGAGLAHATVKVDKLAARQGHKAIIAAGESRRFGKQAQ